MGIEHFFILMLENRSFDHVFGFSNIAGLDKPNPATDNNTDPSNGHVYPVTTGADFSLKNIDADPGHEFWDTLTQLAGPGPQHLDPVTHNYPLYTGKGFVDSYRTNKAKDPGRVMNCFSPAQLPVLHQLAAEFAICDHWFSSLPGPTWANRFFIMAASSGGLTKSPTAADIVKATLYEGYSFQKGNVFDAMDKNKVEWVIFEGDRFPISFALKGMNRNALKGRFVDFGNFEKRISATDFSSKFIFIEPQYGSHKFDVTGPGDYTGGNSMHPLDDVRKGETLIKQVYETIRKYPDVWGKSAILIVFDEHGGFYDHVAPAKGVPPGDDSRNAAKGQEAFQFDMLGVRVPALVISPLVPKGVVDHTIYDHSSALTTAEKLFGFGSLTARDGTANDLLHLFSLTVPRTDTPLTLQSMAPKETLMAEPVVDTPETLRRDLALLESRTYSMAKAEDPLVSDSQIGFAYVALIRSLGKAKTALERAQWKKEFRNMQTRKDAARFMTRAKLKVYYDEYHPRLN